MEPMLRHLPERRPARGTANAPSRATGKPTARGLTPLALPLLAATIPLQVAPAQGRARVAAIARFLLDAGAVTARTWPALCDDALTGCARALTAWLRQHTGALTCFSPCFVLEPLVPHTLPAAQAGSTCTDTGAIKGIAIGWTTHDVCHWTVGPGLDYLEARVPLLGATVLDIMECKGGQVYPLFTPALALDEASYLYWLGEDDEATLLAEEEDEAARAALRGEIPTRADIDAAFPPWALCYRRQRLALRQLTHIARQHPCPYVRRAAMLARTLHATPTTTDYRAEADAPFTGYGAVLCWRDDDVTVRIANDHAQLAWQDTYCDQIGQVQFDLAAPEAMRAWLRRMRPQLRAIGLLDQLLWHLAERE
ncbi:PRTRC system protein F [Pseudoduganella violacea]|uniref:PRTRC genetic system protein F n=1 Tax=Pseudoduganella violacea TaxID=1715466 RepID=A0A7W5BEI5_9BURK|nr:PRTRC system protein F [Pseudoduganella violacea]MBB3121711.1 PRTRC genetic system protein F [Pseudoduganella violacea]